MLGPAHRTRGGEEAEAPHAPTTMGMRLRLRPAWWPRRPAGLAWGLWTSTLLGLGLAAWLDSRSDQAGVTGGPGAGLAAALLMVVATVSAATVGAVLASRRPDHPVGWLLVALGLALAVNTLGQVYVRYGVVARPGALPAAAYLAGPSLGLQIVWLSLAGFVLLLTPTGSLPTARWRWWARVSAVAPLVVLVAFALDPAPLAPEHPEVANPLAIGGLPTPVLIVLAVAAGAVVLAGLPVAGWSLVARYRRARGVERLQLRWLALAAVLASALLVAAVLVAFLLAEDVVVLAAVSTAVALLPLATGAAVLRYRLYDIDRIVSRTVAYGLVTVLLGLGYAAVVLGLGRLLPEGSSLAVAGATLAVAAVFQPLRRRVQRAVDRRFNRRRYDAARTIQAFSARLRDELDLGALEAELLAVVEEAMQPARASLWLRPRRA
jgi:hypothetical protein